MMQFVLKPFKSCAHSSGTTLVEMLVALAISGIIASFGFVIFRNLSSSLETASYHANAAKLTSQLLSDLRFKSRMAEEFQIDPPPASVPPDPDLFPVYPITKFIVRVNTTTSTTYASKCRGTSDSWFRGKSTLVLSKLATKLKDVCSTFYPCPSGQLPFIEVNEQPTGSSRYFPPIGAKPQDGGVYAVALCISWRPEGAGSYDIRAVAGYVANNSVEVGTASSGLTVSNAMLSFTGIKFRTGP